MRDAGLSRADDEQIWAHARAHGFVIITKDDDFRQRSFLHGAPPKVVWVRLGNCRTSDVEATLRLRHGDVTAFAADVTEALLVLSRG